MRRWVVCATLALAAADAQAGPTPFWERVADPHREKIEALIARAQAELGERPLSGGSLEAAGRAEIWAREVLKLDGRNFLATVLLGEALALQRRTADAVRTFDRARAMARTPGEESWCSLRVAIESSRAGQYQAALTEYDRHIRLGEAQSAAYMNSAEILMALGRLAEAQERYREAIRLEAQEQPGRERDENLALAFYGLGVALDRDEQSAAAREAVARALAHDPKLALLDAARDERSDVFFVPPGDVHYYRGLALAVLGRASDATEAFRRFLGEQQGGRWRKRAEAHAAALGTPADPAARPRVRLRLVAAATIRADEALPAPLVDAAWKAQAPAFEACLQDLPAPPQETVRVALDVEFDASGTPRRVGVRAPAEWAPRFGACVEARLKAGLRLPRQAIASPASARLELVLSARR